MANDNSQCKSCLKHFRDNAPVNWNPHPLPPLPPLPPGHYRLLTKNIALGGWGIWQILTPHMGTPRNNVGILTRSAVLTRMGTQALNTMIWVTSPSINRSVIYLQSSLVVYVVLFNNKICCFKKSCFLLYHTIKNIDLLISLCIFALCLENEWIFSITYIL